VLAVMTAALGVSAGCANVQPYERAKLAHPTMTAAETPSAAVITASTRAREQQERTEERTDRTAEVDRSMAIIRIADLWSTGNTCRSLEFCRTAATEPVVVHDRTERTQGSHASPVAISQGHKAPHPGLAFWGRGHRGACEATEDFYR
jgi:hypothetical protein